MVILKGPLHSTTARGSFGPRLTYSKRKENQQVRYQRPNTDRQTATQLTQRSYFLMATIWWHRLTPSEQESWRT